MSRIFQDFIGGKITDDPLTSGATTFNSGALAAVEEIVSTATPDGYMTIVLDPDGEQGAPEIAYITDHTSGATSATISRGEEGTTAREHLDGTSWVAPVTAEDMRPIVAVEDETGTSYTVVTTDQGKVKRFTDASAVTVTLPDGFDIGFLVHLLFPGAGGGSVQDNGTSTVNGSGSVAQHGEASCLVETTDTWNVQGAS